MSYKHSLHSFYCQRSTGLIARLTVIFALLLNPSVGFAQEQEVSHILVLHGNWHERTWDRSFDQAFTQSLLDLQGNRTEIFTQNLGIDKLVSPITRAFYKDNITAILGEQHIDMIVAVMPTAVEFVLEIDALARLPKVLVLPGSDFDRTGLDMAITTVIESNSETAIRRTVDAALALSPETKNVEVFSGAGQTDMEYMSRAQEVSESYPSELSFKFHAGLPAQQLFLQVAQIESDSVAIMLPYASTNDGDFSNLTRNLPAVIDQSTAPFFSFADVWLGSGIVGGYMFSVEKYAKAASESVSALIEGVPVRTGGLEVSGDFIFDYEQISANGFNLDRLGAPYTLINRPRSIFDDYAGFVSTIAALVFLLFVALAWQFVLLNRANVAKLKLQKSEKQARENQVLFELLTHNTLDVIWTWDGEKQRATYCSPTIEQLTGYTVEEFLNLSMFEAMTDSSAAVALDKVYSVTSGAQIFEIELRKKNGEFVWCEIAAQPMEGPVGKNQWVGVTRDISKRKSAEKDQLALHSQLRQSQKFESLGTLAGGIAHDFNNVLGVIMGLTELIRLKTSNNKSALDIADKLIVTTDKAKAMVGQILAFSRQSTSNKESTDLNVLLEESTRIMRTGMPKSIELSIDIAKQPLYVMSDSNQLSQVFINILSNSYEAVDEQTGKIAVSIFETNLEQATKFAHGELVPGRYATVKIEDNGCGLSEDEVEKIFDPFYTSKELGNGMGLAVARGIVIGHGGAIDLHAEKDLGCTVFISLPLIELEPKMDEAVKLGGKETTASTILVVDDQKDLLETVSLMLQELGHKCISCEDPQHAIDCLANQELKIDLVITDYSMPGISGLEIREFGAKHRPDVPVVLATGYSERVAEDDYLKDNPHLVLIKPFGFAELKEMLSRTLSGD